METLHIPNLTIAVLAFDVLLSLALPLGQCHQLKHMPKRLNMFSVLRIFCSFVLLFAGFRTIWAHRDHRFH